jgi:hypothetical protein
VVFLTDRLVLVDEQGIARAGEDRAEIVGLVEGSDIDASLKRSRNGRPSP